MYRPPSHRRGLSEGLLIGLVLAACLGAALAGWLAPSGHILRRGASGQGAGSKSFPTSFLLAADRQDKLTRNSYDGHSPLPQSGAVLWTRGGSPCATASVWPPVPVPIDLAPLYRRPPPIFSI